MSDNSKKGIPNNFLDNSGTAENDFSDYEKESTKKTDHYDELFKKIEEYSVLKSQKQNKETLNAIKEYVRGDSFKQIIESRTKDAVDEYAKEEEFKKVVNEIVRDTEEKLRDKIDDGKLKTIETLGIFVALFTFVSVEFQVFRVFQTPASISGLTLILLGSLIIFLAVLDFVINSIEKVNKKFVPLLIISCIFIIFGIYIFTKTPEEKLNINNDANIENKELPVEVQGIN
jgi:hypothetical protein